MTEEKAKLVLDKFSKQIPKEKRERFEVAVREEATDYCADKLMNTKSKNKIITIILSIFLGVFGVDRFYVGDISLGIAKAIGSVAVVGFIFIPVVSAFGYILACANVVWKIVDIFYTYKVGMKFNYEVLRAVISDTVEQGDTVQEEAKVEA